MSRSGSVLFIILSFPVFLFPQLGDIHGVLTDSSNGERLSFVSVQIAGTTRGTTTNTNGFYMLAGLAPGTYEIIFSSLSFQRRTVTVQLPAGASKTVNVRLLPDDVQMTEVVINAERAGKMKDLSASMHVLDPEELTKIPVAVQGDLLRAVQVLPGIVTTSDVSAKYYVRGGSGDQNLILFDHMKIYNPFHAFGVFSVFDPDLINSTEVFTGAFPAEFGNRLSSVINVTTRGGNTMRLAGTAEVNSMFSKLQLEGPLNKNVSAIGHYRRSMFKDAFNTFLKSDVPLSFYDGFGKVTVETDNNVRYTAEYFFSGDDVAGKTASDATYQWRSESYTVSVSSLASDRLYFHSMVYSSRFVTKRDINNNALISDASSEIKEIGIKSFFTKYADDQSQYHFGFDFSVPEYLNTLRNSANLPVVFESASLDLSAWLRYEYTQERFKYDIGAHIAPALAKEYGFSMSVIQPRVNLSYAVQDDLFAKLSYGRVTQNAITLNNEEDVVSLFESWVSLPNGIRASTSDHYVVGMEYRYQPLSNMTVQTYYKKYSSLSLYNRNKTSLADPDYVAGDGYSYGLEGFLRHKEDWYELLMTYTLGWTNVTADNITYPPRYDRRHTINLAGMVSPLENVEVTARWEIGSGLPFSQTTGFYDRINVVDPFRETYDKATGKPIATLGEKNAARMPWYHRLDLGAHYTYRYSATTKAKIGINIINAYDKRNILYYDRYSEQTVYLLPFYPSFTARVEF
ncbi:MAG: carboxypeptidase-like regulatory domain-containing protein [Bacteroidetes bacterium]|nr:carboxypeptidase-like regulatory domain-containing protein [Bacteroidota bacterium]